MKIKIHFINCEKVVDEEGKEYVVINWQSYLDKEQFEKIKFLKDREVDLNEL